LTFCVVHALFTRPSVYMRYIDVSLLFNLPIRTDLCRSEEEPLHMIFQSGYWQQSSTDMQATTKLPQARTYVAGRSNISVESWWW
jgi:hypothetical protein